MAWRDNMDKAELWYLHAATLRFNCGHSSQYLRAKDFENNKLIDETAY